MLVRIYVDADKTTFGVTDNDFRVIYFLIGRYRIITVYLGRQPGTVRTDKAYHRNLKMVLKVALGS
jgi:hypothetical protein